MVFNAKKCSVVKFGKSARRTEGNYYLGEKLNIRTEEKIWE